MEEVELRDESHTGSSEAINAKKYLKFVEVSGYPKTAKNCKILYK